MAAAACKAISFFTPSLASSSSMSPSKYSTPHKVSEIDAMQIHLQGILVQEGVSASTLIIFDKTRKSTMAGLHAGEMAKQQLHDSQIAAEARDLQAKQSLKQIGHSRQGSLPLESARAILKTTEEQQIEADNTELMEMWENEAMTAEQKKVLKKDIIDNEDDMELHLRLFLNDLRNCNSRVIIDRSCSESDDD
jgi:hypothetical protein